MHELSRKEEYDWKNHNRGKRKRGNWTAKTTSNSFLSNEYRYIIGAWRLIEEGRRGEDRKGKRG